MTLLEVILLGIIQGVTEWLPISSDGHLFLLGQILGTSEGALPFDIFLHLASLLVIIIFFRQQIITVIKAPFVKTSDPSRRRWLWYIMASTIVTSLIGWWLYGHMDYFRTPSMVANFLLLTSLFVFMTRFTRGNQSLNLWHALALGLVQGLAVLPGLSRSGTTIGLAMLLGIAKTEAFEYSFLMVIPAILGAFILSVPDLHFEPIYLVGFVVTALVSYIALGWLKRIISRDYFYLFFIYTFLLGIIIKLL